jgi:hypothetical protein
VVFKAPFHDPNFIGILAPDSDVGRWSNAYRIWTSHGWFVEGKSDISTTTPYTIVHAGMERPRCPESKNSVGFTRYRSANAGHCVAVSVGAEELDSRALGVLPFGL